MFLLFMNATEIKDSTIMFGVMDCSRTSDVDAINVCCEMPDNCFLYTE